MHKLFSSLILLLGYYSKDVDAPKGQNNVVDELLSINLEDKNKTVKVILRILSEIGYCNIWAENYNTLKNN